MFDIESGWNASNSQDILNDRLFGGIQPENGCKRIDGSLKKRHNEEDGGGRKSAKGRKRKKKEEKVAQRKSSIGCLDSDVKSDLNQKKVNIAENEHRKERKKKKRVGESCTIKETMEGVGLKKKETNLTNGNSDVNSDSKNDSEVMDCMESMRATPRSGELPKERDKKKRKKLKKTAGKTESASKKQNLESFSSESFEDAPTKTPTTNVREDAKPVLLEEGVSTKISLHNSKEFETALKGVSTKHTKFQTKLNKKLEGGQFRWINEQLYTNNSSVAQEMFISQPKMFQVYHRGFQTQVNNWPQNPVDVIIRYVDSQGSSLVVADFGCGDAKLARTLPNKVHSFDLVAVNEHVVACDMRNVPLKNACVDLAVFCLSLMGTNLIEFLMEAKRILKNSGTLLIAEVKSRFDNVAGFVDDVSRLGFELFEMDDSNKMFVMLNFKNTGQVSKRDNVKPLKPCIYKRR